MSTQHGLGRGLDTLFKSSAPLLDEKQKESAEGISTLPVLKLVPCQGQPRRSFDESALDELASSIREQGILQPLLVRPAPGDPGAYEIVAGERRWRAAKKAGLSQVPVIIRELDDNEALTIALVENLQREDLNPVEEAHAIAALQKRLKISQDALAAKLGKSRPAVANALRLLQLPENILESLELGEISAGHARALLALSDAPREQDLLFAAVLEKELSVRSTENAVAVFKKEGALPASIDRPEKAPRPPKSDYVKELQKTLRSSLNTRVTVSGTESAGRIIIPYDSSDALNELLERLGEEKF
ncbi:MAG: ParB/RepB/Spo0J family partition protein [Desulfovibrionaceae bacterium]|nr:ParB/RepB/Spo0J family partition protein [Desulfovibrionaceae bacterium]